MKRNFRLGLRLKRCSIGEMAERGGIITRIYYLFLLLLCKTFMTVINAINNSAVPRYAKKLLSGSGKKNNTARPMKIMNAIR